MGFRINRNIPALVARDNIVKNQRGLAQSIERLSTGLRINRGSDDAAGLTISETLRGQIRGLDQAIENAQTGVSLIQTAEGALNETASLLTRIRELAIQAQADTLTSEDRLEIQEEVDELVEEIDRISETTEFNRKKLLDGSSSAIITSNNPQLQGFQSGDVSPGNFDVRLSLKNVGTPQQQTSSIQTLNATSATASLQTTLVSLSSFFDSSGNGILDTPQTLTLRANGEKTSVVVSSDLTTQQFADRVESAITSSVNSGGLGIVGSTFAFDEIDGQFIFQSGLEGNPGEISFAADEDVINAFGFSITTNSQAAAFTVNAQETGVTNPKSFEGNTTTDRASGIIPGLDLKFDLPTEARFDGSVAGSRALNIGTTAVIFTFHDTNSTDFAQAPGNITAGVTITLTANRSFTTASIAGVINDAISQANNPNHALTSGTTSSNFINPGVTASFSGYNLVLTSTATGTSGSISISANTEAQNLLGISNGKVSGSSGSAAAVTGTTNISGGVTIAGAGVIKIRVADGDFNIDSGAVDAAGSTATNITFNRGSALTSTSVVNTINSYLLANNIKASASTTSSGFLQIVSTEAGTDSRISISANASLSDLGLTSGQNNQGSGGNAAVVTGSTATGIQDIGYTLQDKLRFSITDKNGNQTPTFYFGTQNVSNGEGFAISQSAITSILNNSNLSSTDVDFQFDPGNRLDLFSRTAGGDSRITLAAVSSNGNDALIGQEAFGITFDTSAQGSGETDFKININDNSLRFQIGANRGQALSFQVFNAGAESLGVKGLDVSSIRSANIAISTIDDASRTISSERAKLGAVENRLGSAVDSLTTTSTNLQTTESLIRDVDLAIETVEFTRRQILIQSGTAQLVQANTLSQGVLAVLN